MSKYLVNGVFALAISFLMFGCGGDKADSKSGVGTNISAVNTGISATKVETSYKFGQGSNGTKLLKSGWSYDEIEHVWSEGKRSVLAVPVDASLRQADIKITLTIAPLGNKQTVVFSTSDKELFKKEITKTEVVSFYVPKSLVQSDSLELIVDVPGATSARELSIGNDARTLGISLITMYLSN